MKIGYVRVSSSDQNESRQKEALKEKGIERWFLDKRSGKDTNRPALQEMLQFMREGDEIYISEFSRLARNTADLLKLIDIFKEKKITLFSCKEQFDTSTSTGRLMVTMIGAIAEFEREMIRERQREGIDLAKDRGVYKGRKKIEIENVEEYYSAYMTRKTNLVEISKELGISRQTVAKLFKEYKEKNHAEDDIYI